MRSPLLLCAVLALLTLSSAPARAVWVLDGVALSTAANYQFYPTIASDGAAGAIVTWFDARGGTGYDIYAQRVDASGAPQWTADGLAICTADLAQSNPTIVSDGAGGAIITWDDVRTGNRVIYAQRVNASGVAQWTADGVAMSTDTAGQYPTIVSDGAGGAIITWYDAELDFIHISDVYAQRVDASGVVQWDSAGVLLCTAAGDQQYPKIVSDGAGGAIITWYDTRSGGGFNGVDIYAQRVDASGVVQWNAEGVALCTAAGRQIDPTIASDGAGGAIVTWYDDRNLTAGVAYDVYAQRVDAAGTPQWTVDGVALCAAANRQWFPTIVSDDAGGAIVTWYDYRTGGSSDIYAQRVNASGAPQWTADGVALCVISGVQAFPTIVPDGAGGAIVSWQDSRSGTADVYAQRVDALGVRQWTANGIALSAAAGDQRNPMIVSDGAAGAIVTWMDIRSGAADIYAQRVFASGSVPTGVRDTPPTTALIVLQNHPNPFSATTTLDIGLASASPVEIEVFDVAGRRVRGIRLEGAEVGWRSVPFDGRDDRGRALASGVYFCRVRAGGTTVTRKMILAR
jgi:hypothetical protein